jgi:anti-anti-sigma factor
MKLLLETAKRKNHTFFKVIGELNYDGALRLKKAFGDALALGEIFIIIDFTKCRTITSFALSILLRINDTLKEKKGTLRFICPSGNVLEVFDVVDVKNIIPVFATENELWHFSTETGSLAILP